MALAQVLLADSASLWGCLEVCMSGVVFLEVCLDSTDPKFNMEIRLPGHEPMTGSSR